MEDEKKKVKIVLEGPAYTGKTCLAMTYTTGVFPSDYIPTVCENCEGKSNVKGIEINYEIMEAAGHESMMNIRKLTYDGVSVFLLCVAIDKRDKFEGEIKTTWLPFMQEVCPDVPIILVGTQIDLREDQEQQHVWEERGITPISPEEGIKLAIQIGAIKYMECSALGAIGLKELFDAAFEVGLEYTMKQNKEEHKKEKEDGKCCCS